MRLAAALVLIMVPSGAASLVHEAEFASPLIMLGDLDLSFNGRLLLLAGPGEAAAFLDWRGQITALQETQWQARSTNDVLRTTEDGWIPSADSWEGRNVAMHASATKPLAAMQMWADEIRVVLYSGDVHGSSERVASCWGNLVDGNRSRSPAWHRNPCGEGEVGWRIGSPSGARIEAMGLSYVELLGFDWSCTSTDCPPSESVFGTQADVVPTPLASARTYTYAVMNGADGVLTINTTADALYAASSVMAFSLDGVARLPRYHGPLADPAGNQTLRVEGLFAGTELSALPGGRFTGTLSPPEVIFLDETPLGATGKTVAAAATVGLLALLAKAVLGLLTRTRARALRSPRRRELLSYIESHPGATFRELVRGTDIPAGTARHHVGVLKQANLIMEKPHNQTLRYFENHGRFEDSWNSVVLLREPELKSLHAWLLRHNGSTQKEILAWAEGHGWSRSTAQHRLKRLENEGLVSMRPMGRWKCYTAHKRAPVPS